MIKKLSYLFLLIGIFLNAQVLAQPELDTTFGGTGGFTVPSPNSGSTADLAIQPDGKILIMGACRNINAPFHHEFCISRLNEDGSSDNSFGFLGSGYVLTIVPGVDLNSGGGGTGIAVQNNNKIIAVGTVTTLGQKHPVFVRYNPDGSLDSEFGNDGIIISPIFGRAMEIVVLADDKFLIVGIDESSSFKHFVARYSSDGIIDTSFGNNGISVLDFPNTTSLGLSIALQPDGKILTGGYITTGLDTPNPTSSYLLTRLNQNGSLDPTFDDDGIRIADYSNPSIIFRQPGFLSIQIQTDGRILALGSSNVLYRFNSDGSFDTGFDEDGSREALNGTGGSSPFDLVVTPSGKITVVGYRPVPNTQMFPNFTPKFRVARYLSNGSPDLTFSEDGFLDFTPEGPAASGATAAILDSRGRVVVGGLATSQILFGGWQTPSFSIARFMASPIQNVGFTGRVTKPNGRPIANAVLTLQSGNEIVRMGRTNPFGYFRFQNIQSGQTYTISTRAKGLHFIDRSVLVDDEITSFSIIGTQP